MDRNVLMVPSFFRCMNYINDDTYFTGDWAPAHNRIRRNNFQFVQMVSPQMATELTNFGVISTKKCMEIEPKKVLYVDYKSAYSFSER